MPLAVWIVKIYAYDGKKMWKLSPLAGKKFASDSGHFSKGPPRKNMAQDPQTHNPGLINAVPQTHNETGHLSKSNSRNVIGPEDCTIMPTIFLAMCSIVRINQNVQSLFNRDLYAC